MRISALLSLGVLSLAVAACNQPMGDKGHEGGAMDMNHHHGEAAAEKMHEGMWSTVTEAVAVIYPTKGNSVSGTIAFSKTAGGVHIHGTVTGLEPNTPHALHIHEFGDATSADGMSTGGHFNPEGHKHGNPNAPEHHAGDFGNIMSDATGKATVDLTVNDLSVAGLKNPVIGRGLVIHAKADDFMTQPTGNAGGRIGVGVIGIAKSQP